MTVAQGVLLEGDVRDEIQDLRQQLLPLFQAFVPLGVLAWYYHVVYTEMNKWLTFWPFGLMVLGTLGVWWVGKRHYAAACWLLMATLLTLHGLLIAVHISPLALAFGALLVIMAHALLGVGQSLLVVLLTVAVAQVVLFGFAPPAALERPIADALALYGLVWVVTWLAGRPLQSLIESTFEGWSQARNALLELRERRGELYRVVRALEEATARIERINNQLVVAQHEAETARAVKTRLTATVSHELRGPLNLILGFSELMALSPESYPQPLPESYRADVFTIYRNSQHLLTLVNDVLDLSKIDAQRLPLTKDRVDINADVVHKVADNVRPLAERRQLYLRLDLDEHLPSVVADAVRLRQALLNLLTNAIRFTPVGGITVRTAQKEGQILVSVQDTGLGIPEQDLPDLFKEFHQLQQKEMANQEGAGLGLAIAKHLVELHGGQIWVESKRGMGTSFYFSIPLNDVEAAQTERKTAARAVLKDAPVDCLIIHEDPRVAGLIGRYMEGARVVGVPDDQQVGDMVNRLHPRAILADPERVPGIQAALDPTGYDVPIISCALPHLQREFASQGILRYLVKPVVPDLLLEAVSAVEREGETTILLVDDEPDTIRLMERMLANLPRPYHVLKAYDGGQALEMMRESPPDIVFLDMLMPRLDGQSTIAHMRADARTRDVPVVIVSAHDWLEDQAVLQAPISLHARRPVNIATGSRCVQALMNSLSPAYLPAPKAP